jgi:NAD(P)-dependent dehydrogenase (short-subunit alcohol dehydrogenase family)
MFNQASVDRRVAVVTGGSGAIGRAIAARLASDHTVAVDTSTVSGRGPPGGVHRHTAA